MKNATTTALAVAAALACVSAAHADLTINIPGSYTFVGTAGHTITVPAVTGSFQGIRVTFTYSGGIGSSTPYDAAFTVGNHQWGGYLPFINGAGSGESPTGAPSTSFSSSLTFNSNNLGIGQGQLFNNQTAVVGFGNGNGGGGCTLSNISITLLGVVPTPGAAAALSLGGLGMLRRRR